ncbi:dehydrosqualene synthase [Staphylococcus aureus]|nr:dehydrosqualene synthase [Staphylococcus aureus]
MFETDAELFGYCYGVAGTVGEVLTPILSDHETHQTYDVARRLGESLQLINILRDVGEDFENERIYFSKQRLKQYEVDIAEVYQNGVNNHYMTYGNIMQLSQKKIFEMLWIKSKYLVLKHNQS